MAKNKLNKNWLHDHINDPYVKLAQKEGYRARAAYKLKEIDEAEKLIKAGNVVVDLGCTPGSWAQYTRRKLAGKDGGGIHGTIIGLDILPMEPVADVQYIQGDFREEEVLTQLDVVLADRKVDVVLSDMAPNLSGIGNRILAGASEAGRCAAGEVFQGHGFHPDPGKIPARVYDREANQAQGEPR